MRAAPASRRCLPVRPAHTARMSGITPGNQQSPGQSDVYWRRRVIALAAGIAVVGLVAWTVNGALGGGAASPRPRQVVSGQREQRRGTRPRPAARPPRPPGRPRGHAGSVTQGGAQRQRAARPGAPGHRSAGPRAPRAGGPRGAGARDRGHVSSRRRRAQPLRRPVQLSGARPCRSSSWMWCPPRRGRAPSRWAPGTCSCSSGQAASAGCWDSADCARPAGPQAARLAKGVPAVLNFTWDRKTSAPGCLAAAPGGPARDVDRDARYSGRLSSQPLIFVLRAPGIGVP